MFLWNTVHVWVRLIMFQNRGKGETETGRMRTTATASDENMFGPAPHPWSGCGSVRQIWSNATGEALQCAAPPHSWLYNTRPVLHNGSPGDVWRGLKRVNNWKTEQKDLIDRVHLRLLLASPFNCNHMLMRNTSFREIFILCHRFWHLWSFSESILHH